MCLRAPSLLKQPRTSLSVRRAGAQARRRAGAHATPHARVPRACRPPRRPAPTPLTLGSSQCSANRGTGTRFACMVQVRWCPSWRSASPRKELEVEQGAAACPSHESAVVPARPTPCALAYNCRHEHSRRGGGDVRRRHQVRHGLERRRVVERRVLCVCARAGELGEEEAAIVSCAVHSHTSRAGGRKGTTQRKRKSAILPSTAA